MNGKHPLENQSNTENIQIKKILPSLPKSDPSFFSMEFNQQNRPLTQSNQTLLSESLAFLKPSCQTQFLGGQENINKMGYPLEYFRDLKQTPNLKNLRKYEIGDSENNTKVSDNMKKTSCQSNCRMKCNLRDIKTTRKDSDFSCGVLKHMDTNCGSNDLESRNIGTNSTNSSNFVKLIEENLHHNLIRNKNVSRARLSNRNVHNLAQTSEIIKKEKRSSQPTQRNGSRNRTSIMTHGISKIVNHSNRRIPTDIIQMACQNSKPLDSTDFWNQNYENNERNGLLIEDKKLNNKNISVEDQIDKINKTNEIIGIKKPSKKTRNETSAIQYKQRDNDSRKSQSNSHLMIGSFGRDCSWNVLNQENLNSFTYQNSFKDFYKKNIPDSNTLLPVENKPLKQERNMNVEFLEYVPTSGDQSQKNSFSSSHSEFHDVYSNNKFGLRPEFLNFPNQQYLNSHSLIQTPFIRQLNSENKLRTQNNSNNIISNKLRIDLCPSNIILERGNKTNKDRPVFKKPNLFKTPNSDYEISHMERNYVSRRMPFGESQALEIISESNYSNFEKANQQTANTSLNCSNKTLPHQNKNLLGLNSQEKIKNFQQEVLKIVQDPENYFIDVSTKRIYLKMDVLNQNIESKISKPFQTSQVNFQKIQDEKRKIRKDPSLENKKTHIFPISDFIIDNKQSFNRKNQRFVQNCKSKIQIYQKYCYQNYLKKLKY